MKGSKLTCSLLVLLVACAGCRAQVQAESLERIQVTTEERVAIDRARLPDTLSGIWYPIDSESTTKCERFRALSSTPEANDEAIVVLAGSVVVTTRLIHVFREYGEGDFHVVERVERDGVDAWRIITRIGIDAMPDDAYSDDSRVTSHLSLRERKLQWRFPSYPEGSSTYFRCDAVPPDMQPHMTERKIMEGMS